MNNRRRNAFNYIESCPAIFFVVLGHNEKNCSTCFHWIEYISFFHTYWSFFRAPSKHVFRCIPIQQHADSHADNQADIKRQVNCAPTCLSPAMFVYYRLPNESNLIWLFNVKSNSWRIAIKTVSMGRDWVIATGQTERKCIYYIGTECYCFHRLGSTTSIVASDTSKHRIRQGSYVMMLLIA